VALCVFVFFLVISVYIHYHIGQKGMERKWKLMMCILYIDMALLITRSSYRVAEYGDLQYQNAVSTNESLFYTLDVLEMLILNFLWIPFHPGFWGMLDEEKEEIDS
jgi:SNF family Na+-dependent transporter